MQELLLNRREAEHLSALLEAELTLSNCISVDAITLSHTPSSDMDPLSITASIVGILAAAGKLSELLSSIFSTTKDAPKVVNALMHEISDIQAALSSLQVLLDHLSTSPKRRTALIQIDSLIVTFTESVVTFSELENIISPFAASTSANFQL